MLEIERSVIIPIVARLVGPKQQKALVSRVIKSIGLSDLRTHLVAMHEAVMESKDKHEIAVFHQKVDFITRMMIPRWKHSLYDPQTRFLV